MNGTIYHHSFRTAETAPGSLHPFYTDALKHGGFTILNFVEHHFSPQGYTALWLLGESHLAIHTFPELGFSYVEITSCNRAMFDRFLAFTGQEAAQPQLI